MTMPRISATTPISTMENGNKESALKNVVHFHFRKFQPLDLSRIFSLESLVLAFCRPHSFMYCRCLFKVWVKGVDAFLHDSFDLPDSLYIPVLHNDSFSLLELVI